MTWIEDVCETYHRLAMDGAAEGDVHAGENSEKIAKEKGISEESWADARMAMRMGQEMMQEELARGIPQTGEEREQRIRSLIHKEISGYLQTLSSDEERRARLLLTLQAAQQMNENDVARLGHLDTEALEEMLVDLAMSWTKNRVLPDLQQQCRLLMQNEQQEQTVLDNAGALAEAVYMNSPQAQAMPEAVGCCAGIIKQCREEGSAAHNRQDTSACDAESSILDQVAFGLFVVAAMSACVALLTVGSSALASAVAHVGVEGTVAGLGAAVAADISYISESIIAMLVLALGSFLLGGAAYLLECFMSSGESCTTTDNERDEEDHEDDHEDEDDEEDYDFVTNIVKSCNTTYSTQNENELSV